MRALLLAGLALVGGCALAPQAAEPPPADAGPVAGVPFFPQTAHACGPAALATLLVQRGIVTTPAELGPRIYVPGRRGSFQAELIAAIRSAGLVPWQIDGRLPALAQELTAGRPVLVLQNLLLPSLPRWHYAVAYGIDSGSVLLRSGRIAELRSGAPQFLRSWRAADYWGVVALRPGELPAAPDAVRWLETYAAFESLGQPQQARLGYETGVRHWPQEPLLWFALGNSQYRASEVAAAETSWRHAVRLAPDFAPAWNNLAQLLAERGCGAQADAALAQARAHADERLGATLADTARVVAASPSDGSGCTQ
jgi:tetratricopeptide (TPR) repeat protein